MTLISTQISSLCDITLIFFAAKFALFLILQLQNTEYDTSSASILFANSSDLTLAVSQIPLISQILKHACIWDTVFHVSSALRAVPAHKFEHEWAFGIAWNRVIRKAAQWMPVSIPEGYPRYTAAAIVVSTISHYMACIIFYYVTLNVFSSSNNIDQKVGKTYQKHEETLQGKDKNVNLTIEEKLRNSEKIQRMAEIIARRSAILFALTPAGVFMATGYAESTFALIALAGIWMRLHGFPTAAAALFGVATLLRSNGLFFGIFYLYDLIRAGQRWARGGYSTGLAVADIISAGIGGTVIGACFFGVQVYAYDLYCKGSNISHEGPEWCQRTLPLIYPYIQEHYWNNGFLRYWTPNNIPNFLFAMPTLTIMVRSLMYYTKRRMVGKYTVPLNMEVIRPIAIVQAVMLVSCVTSWHVQIITRVGGSSLLLTYWYTAELLGSTKLQEVKEGKLIVRYSVVWILVQAVLYSAFMPPA